MSFASSPVAHIGRVGALAVALGIGAAVVGGGATAWADRTDQTDTDSQTSAETSTGAPSSGRPSVGASRRGAGLATSNTPRVTSSQADTDTADALEVPDGPDDSELATARRAATTRSSAADSSSDNNAPVSTPGAAAAVVVPAPAAVADTSTSENTTTVRVQPAPAAATPAPAATALVTAPVVTTVDVPAAAAAVTMTPVVVPAVSKAPSPGPLASLVSNLLSAVGLGSLAGNRTPGVPVESPALWALLGWVRSDPGRRRAVTDRTALPTAAVPTATVALPTSLGSTPIGWVTGQANTGFPGASWTQTNNTRWANVYGTDLGIMWFNGDNQLTQLAFGDTFSGPNMSGDWRSNILLLSNDRQLNNGLTLLNTGPAYQFIPAAPGQVFFIGSEVTNIPTSAIYANNTNYVNYMSVKSWDTPGRWTTNYSAISQYNPLTDKWVLQKGTVRPAGYFRSSTMYQPGDQNFQQMAYVLQPESKVTGDTRYVYALGTPAGRTGSAYLSRVSEDAVTNLKQYQYWDGNKWVSDAAKAAPIIGESTKSTGPLGALLDWANDPNVAGGRLAGFVGAKTGGNVSEMSIQYNEYLDKYVVLYGNGANNIILRTADTPEGAWSDPITIATSVQYPGLYAPMIHPLSGTGLLTDGTNPDVSNLYWNMSLWGNYNVVLMKTDLSALKVTVV